jgi:hypothetical protein
MQLGILTCPSPPKKNPAEAGLEVVFRKNTQRK